MYANAPGFVQQGTNNIRNILDGKTVQVFDHHGHSPHLSETLALIRDSANLLVFGSCGSARSVGLGVYQAPNSQVLSTKGTGTREINNNLLSVIQTQMLLTGKINWDSVWSRVESEHPEYKNEDHDWQNYLKPTDNKSLQFIRQYEQYMKADHAQMAIPKPTGGIDMNNLDLDTQGRVTPLNLPADPAQLHRKIPGLVPQIISINRIDLLGFLGIQDHHRESKQSSSTQPANGGLSPMTKPETA